MLYHDNILYHDTMLDHDTMLYHDNMLNHDTMLYHATMLYHSKRKTGFPDPDEPESGNFISGIHQRLKRNP